MPRFADKHLAWFLGPKAENGALFEEACTLILRDYVHWRRNYFPGDKILLSQQTQRLLEAEHDLLEQKTMEMMAELRRNFPFYSPRYLGHQLSDTTLPAMIGYLAALLYNPNNVTPESSPVTADFEIEACNRMLSMLGFTPPPAPPRQASEGAIEEYRKQIKLEFGWAHTTFGGTTANLEALWVARTVRYFPLGVLSVAREHDLPIELKLPGSKGQPVDIRTLGERDVLLIRPNEAIYLLARYVEAVRARFDITSLQAAGERAWQLHNSSEYGLGKGTGTLFGRFPPVIFASGAAHYSVKKAADVLGIGRENVVTVKTDTMFRMDMEDLRQKIEIALRRNQIPVAVVAVAGTTEEGAVDPIHLISDLREALEKENNASFWLHIDAALGGYVRTLFRPSDAILARVASKLGVEYEGELPAWNDRVFAALAEVTARGAHPEFSSRLEATRVRLRATAEEGDDAAYVRELQSALLTMNSRLAESGAIPPFERADFEPRLQDRIELAGAFVQDGIEISWGDYHKAVSIKWGEREVCSAFTAFAKADSITVDPHKMGYVPYPCGVLAFRNDRVRHFVLQEAPYVTSRQQNVLLHNPPKHADLASLDEGELKVAIDAFAPFILEGSRPGAPATALWMATTCIPLTMHGHGLIVRASLLAARELYEWLIHWPKAVRHQMDTDYDFVPLTPFVPDTNIVIFTVKKRTSASLRTMNALSKAVYDRFSIQPEFGGREYSYSQPFFLTKTRWSDSSYPVESLKDFFCRCGIKNAARDYREEGLIVLRAAVLNPYISSMRKYGVQNMIKEFMKEMAAAAEQEVRNLGQQGGK